MEIFHVKGGYIMIAIASDHAGFELKNFIIEYLKEKNFKYKDYGCYTKESVDYPDMAIRVAEGIKNGICDKGVLICGTGIGVSMAANKVPGIRAALCSDAFSAKMSRAHNNSNVLALGARVIGEGLALDILDAWLSTEFEGGRHASRVAKINEIECNCQLT